MSWSTFQRNLQYRMLLCHRYDRRSRGCRQLFRMVFTNTQTDFRLARLRNSSMVSVFTVETIQTRICFEGEYSAQRPSYLSYHFQVRNIIKNADELYRID